MKRTSTKKLCAFIDDWLDVRCKGTRKIVLEQACDEIDARAKDGDRVALHYIKCWIRGAMP